MFNKGSLKKTFEKGKKVTMRPSELAQFLSIPTMFTGLAIYIYNPVAGKWWLIGLGFVALGMFALGLSAYVFRLKSPRLIASKLNTSVFRLDPIGSYTSVFQGGPSTEWHIFACEGIGALGVHMEGGGSAGFAILAKDSYFTRGEAVFAVDDMIKVEFEELDEGLQDYLLKHTKFRIGNPIYWALSVPNAHRYAIEIHKKGRAQTRVSDLVAGRLSANAARTQLMHLVKSERQLHNYGYRANRRGRDFMPVSEIERERTQE